MGSELGTGLTKLTDEQIDNLPANELRIAVAKAMGYQVISYPKSGVTVLQRGDALVAQVFHPLGGAMESQMWEQTPGYPWVSEAARQLIDVMQDQRAMTTEEDWRWLNNLLKMTPIAISREFLKAHQVTA